MTKQELGKIGHADCTTGGMLKLLGSYVIAKVLGLGIIGAIVIYFVLSVLS